MDQKLLYIAFLVGLSFVLYRIVGWLSFHGIDGFNPVCMLLSIIAAHLITIKLLDNTSAFESSMPSVTKKNEEDDRSLGRSKE